MTRFTFVVCASCGVQSQPLIFNADHPSKPFEKLELMGWGRFQGADYCPSCEAKRVSHENEKLR